MIWSDFEFVTHLACIIKTRILDIIWPCLSIIMIMTWLLEGILFICALVVSCAARAQSTTPDTVGFFLLQFSSQETFIATQGFCNDGWRHSIIKHSFVKQPPKRVNWSTVQCFNNPLCYLTTSTRFRFLNVPLITRSNWKAIFFFLQSGVRLSLK